MSRKPLIAGNWKMNVNHIEAVGLLQKLCWNLADHKYDAAKSECVVIPPFTNLRTVQTLIEGDRLPVEFGAQDVSQYPNGAYTGDISAEMLVKLGCRYVIIGHSERRLYHQESDAIVNAKVRRALEAGLSPILCIGEDLEVRKIAGHIQHSIAQLDEALQGVSAAAMASVVIAYEPIWAIGTGEVATPDDAEEVCGAVRARIAELYDEQVADELRVLYGGSVKAATIGMLMAEENIDGALVGGASLDPDEFALITRFYDLKF